MASNVDITIGPIGEECFVLVGGTEMKGVKCITIYAETGYVTTATIEIVNPSVQGIHLPENQVEVENTYEPERTIGGTLQ